jgi:drug/metabolite transporter (DMT)-like permease
MNWILAMVICFVLWSIYAIPGNMAEKVHGVSVNMAFETLAFILVTLMFGGKIVENLPKVTASSATFGLMMGVGSALGFYFFLLALSNAPGARGLALVVLVAGVSFPVQSLLFSFFGDGEALNLRQWLAIAGMGTSLVIYNWK